MAKQDEFSENENKPEENNSDENFGLPDIEYKPLENKEEEEAPSIDNKEEAESENKYHYTPEPEPRSNAALIIGLIIALIVVTAGYLIYQYVIVPKSEKAKQEELARKEIARKKTEEARLAKEREEAEKAQQQQQTEVVNTAPPAGTVEILTEKTSRYYVVISSAIDDDLAMDYAKKLSADGNSIKIIPPFGKSQFHRVTMGEYESFADAQNSANALKSTYGDALWVIKY